MADKEILYEKIAEISEQREDLIKKNDKLKKQIKDYYSNLYDDCCDLIKVVVERIDLDEESEIDEREKSTEELIIKGLTDAIKNRAKELGISPKELAKKVANKIGVGA